MANARGVVLCSSLEGGEFDGHIQYKNRARHGGMSAGDARGSLLRWYWRRVLAALGEQPSARAGTCTRTGADTSATASGSGR